MSQNLATTKLKEPGDQLWSSTVEHILELLLHVRNTPFVQSCIWINVTAETVRALCSAKAANTTGTRSTARGNVVPWLDRVPLSRWWDMHMNKTYLAHTICLTWWQKWSRQHTGTRRWPLHWELRLLQARVLITLDTSTRPLQPAYAKGWTNKVGNMSIIFIIISLS